MSVLVGLVEHQVVWCSTLQGFAEHKSDHAAFTPKGARQKAKKLLCDLVGDTTTSCMCVVLGAAGWFVLVFLYDGHSHWLHVTA